MEELGAATSAHNHDNRYYTEREINGKLDTKADVSHTHDIGNITGANRDDILKLLRINNTSKGLFKNIETTIVINK